MEKFILGFVVVLFAAGGAGAVNLQPGDLVTSGNPPGTYALYGDSRPALTRADSLTGELEVISGCLDADCTTVIGSGLVPRAIEQIAVANSGEILVTAELSLADGWVDGSRLPALDATGGNASEVSAEHPLAPCNAAVAVPLITRCRALLSVDPVTGNRTLIAASLFAYNDNSDAYSFEILVGSGLALSNTASDYPALAIVPPDPDPIPAGLPLPHWIGVLMVGFMLGASYMKGKYDGRAAA